MPILYTEVQETAKRFAGFECNRCKAKYDESNYIEVDNAFIWDAYGGYGSVWGDQTDIEIILCQNCAYELLKDYATIEQRSD